MESILFVLNCVAVVYVVYMSLRNDRRSRNTPQFGFFRYADTAAKAAEEANKPKLTLAQRLGR